MLLASTMASFLTNLLPSSGGAVDTTVNAAVDMAKASQRAFQAGGRREDVEAVRRPRRGS